MIVIELLIGILIAGVVITGIMKVAAPIADAFSERLRLKFQELGPEQERQFRTRMEGVEQQVLELQSQVANLQEIANFNAGIAKPNIGDRVKGNEPLAVQHHRN
ncbi:hypothetical protein BH10CYA1_BH10CYA1_24600 [soil metagenome]